MNSTVLRCKRETAENETKSGAHTWQRDCAHARLVTRDGEIEITVTVARTVGRINFAPVARLGGLAPARPITAPALCTSSFYELYNSTIYHHEFVLTKDVKIFVLHST